jgi:putative membrane protein insertion efficiency factor
LKKLSNIISVLLILPVKFYQLAISPYLHPSCRHVPSCSNYAIGALRVHGPLKGSWFAIRRILHCHPWGTSGYDPVPEKGKPIFKFKKYKAKNHA